MMLNLEKTLQWKKLSRFVGIKIKYFQTPYKLKNWWPGRISEDAAQIGKTAENFKSWTLQLRSFNIWEKEKKNGLCRNFQEWKSQHLNILLAWHLKVNEKFYVWRNSKIIIIHQINGPMIQCIISLNATLR